MVFIPNHTPSPKGPSDNSVRTSPSITLVGAGPGDPELITVKGLRAIQAANVILYDALVDPRILKEAAADCECIFVGKRAGKHYSSQENINQLLVEKALEKGNVVRLKGGDPFVFGRGYEELDYASMHGIKVHVIPGISSCISVPGLQHIPMTCRGINESFWVVTASTRSGELSKDLDLAIQSSSTIAILMGTRKIDQIARKFAEAGKGDIPCMVVQNGSASNERFVIGNMHAIQKKMLQHQIGAPGIIIVGEVVRLHPAWENASQPSLFSNSSKISTHGAINS